MPRSCLQLWGIREYDHPGPLAPTALVPGGHSPATPGPNSWLLGTANGGHPVLSTHLPPISYPNPSQPLKLLQAGNSDARLTAQGLHPSGLGPGKPSEWTAFTDQPFLESELEEGRGMPTAIRHGKKLAVSRFSGLGPSKEKAIPAEKGFRPY